MGTFTAIKSLSIVAEDVKYLASVKGELETLTVEVESTTYRFWTPADLKTLAKFVKAGTRHNSMKKLKKLVVRGQLGRENPEVLKALEQLKEACEARGIVWAPQLWRDTPCPCVKSKSNNR